MCKFKNFGNILSQKQIDELDELLTDAICDYEISSDYYDKITIVCNSRLRTCAGKFCWNTMKFNEYKESKIELNPKYLSKFGFDNVKKTFAHEVAHLINLTKYGEKGHGWSFKEICKNLGGHMNEYYAGINFKECGTKEFIKTNFKWNYKCKCGINNTNYKRRASFNIRTFGTCKKCNSNLTETKL